jgi:hypothetical protein
VDLPPFTSVDSVTWPSLSTIVVPSENATDLRGLRSAASACISGMSALLLVVQSSDTSRSWFQSSDENNVFRAQRGVECGGRRTVSAMIAVVDVFVACVGSVVDPVVAASTVLIMVRR